MNLIPMKCVQYPLEMYDWVGEIVSCQIAEHTMNKIGAAFSEVNIYSNYFKSINYKFNAIVVVGTFNNC